MRRPSGFGLFELIIGVLLIALGVSTFARPEGLLTGVIDICSCFKVYRLWPDAVAHHRNSQCHERYYDTRVSGCGEVGAFDIVPDVVHCALCVTACPDRHGTYCGQILLLLFLAYHKYYRYSSRIHDDSKPVPELHDNADNVLHCCVLPSATRYRRCCFGHRTHYLAVVRLFKKA